MIPKNNNTDAKLPDKAKLRTEIQRILTAGNVPGAAVLILANGEEYLAEGFGVQNIDTRKPVDRFTMFACASQTKQHTAAGLAKFMELYPDKLQWKVPVQNVLPDLMFSNQFAVRGELTLLDLVLHRTGLSRHDVIWGGLLTPKEEIMRRLRYVALSWLCGREFHYNNLGWLVAGMMLEKICGKSWFEFLQEQLDQPLGMQRTNYSVKDLAGMENVATPYIDFGDGKGVVPMNYHACDNIGPAASMNSCIDDLSKWLLMMLNYGMYNGKQILKAESVRFMHTQHQAIEIANPSRGPGAPEMKFFGYGPGWFIEELRGYQIAQHGGNLLGMTSLIAMIQELNIGIVFLCNLDGAWIREALMYKIFDAFIALSRPDIDPEYDWCTTSRLYHEEEMRKEAAAEKQRWTHPDGTTISGPQLDLAAYQGTYHDDFWGTASIKLVGDKLALKMDGDLAGVLEHWSHDTFALKFVNQAWGRTKITFQLNEEDKVVSVQNQEYFGLLQRISDSPADIPLEALVETMAMPPKPKRHRYKYAYHHPSGIEE